MDEPEASVCFATRLFVVRWTFQSSSMAKLEQNQSLFIFKMLQIHLFM
jgi:hypothetical protein